MLLLQYMKYLSELSSYCVEISKKNKNWNIVYDTGIVFLFDNLVSRYESIFTKNGIDTNYEVRSEIENLYKESTKSPRVYIKGVELKDLSKIAEFEDRCDVRGNTESLTALIQYYTNEQSIRKLKTFIENCEYPNDKPNCNLLALEVIRRIEKNEF